MIISWHPSYYHRAHRQLEFVVGIGWIQGPSTIPVPPPPIIPPTGVLAPVYFDWYVRRGDDGFLKIATRPSVAIGGWSVHLTIAERFGGAVIADLYLASGFNATSGISMVSSGAGVFQAHLSPVQTSGWDEGAYACLIERTDTTNNLEIANGYLLLI